MPGQMPAGFVPDGFEPDQLPAAPQTPPAPRVTPVTRENFNAVLAEGRRKDDAGRVASAEALPAVGGLIGGLVGGIPGAAAGGFVGDMGKQVVRRELGASSPKTISAQATQGATQAAVQGASQGAGQLLSAGAGKAGTWLMNRALNTTDRLAREFPELSKTMIDNAITVSKGGLAKAKQLLVSHKSEANAALAKADAKGVTIPITDVTKALNKTFATVANSADPVGGARALVNMAKKIAAGRKATLTMAEADALKRSLQSEAKALYRSLTAANGRTPVTLMAEGKADMAAALNDAIEAATAKAGAPGYKAANYAAKEMIGATRAVTHAIRPGSNLYQAMVRPGVGAVLGGAAGSQEGHPILGAVAGAAMTSPQVMSIAALGLGNPAVRKWLEQLPRGTAAAVMAALQDEPPTPQTTDLGQTR